MAVTKRRRTPVGQRVHGVAVCDTPWWYELPPSAEEIDAEISALRLGSKEGISVADAKEIATERVVRRTVSDKLKEWYRGVAAWSDEDRERAKASARRMKEHGYLL